MIGAPYFGRPTPPLGWRWWRDGGVGAGVLGDEIGMRAQAVAGPLDLDDDGVVEEAIEQGGGDDRVAEDVTPAKARRPLSPTPKETRSVDRGGPRSRGLR